MNEQRTGALSRAWSAFKSVWTINGGRPGFHDRDNFTTNRVTVAHYDDSQNAGGSAGLSATYACTNLIAGTIGSIPPAVLKPGTGGIEVDDRAHPLFPLLHDSPNADQSAVEFWEQMAQQIELAGDAFAVIGRESSGKAISLTPPEVPPSQVRIERRMGRRWYLWSENSRTFEVPEERMLHLKGPGGTKLRGATPLAKCRGVFDSAISAQTAAGAMFRNGVRPSGVMSIEERLLPEQRAQVQGYLDEKMVGALHAGRPMLVDGGMKWQALSINPQDAQMLESRRFSVEEICRIFEVPPHMIGHVDKTTSWGAGVEQMTLGFLMFTMRRRFKRIEAQASKQLLTPVERAAGTRIKFDMRELMRGDSKGRSEYYERMSRIGGMTINEIRREENLPPVTGGDTPRLQMQNVPIDQADAIALDKEPTQ